MCVADLCQVLSQVWQDHVLLLPDQIFKHAYLHQPPTSPWCKEGHAPETHAPALGCLCLASSIGTLTGIRVCDVISTQITDWHRPYAGHHLLRVQK